MAFTTNKKLSAQAAASASGTWGAGGTTGVDLNTGVIGPLDTILAGVSTFSVSSSNISLSFTAGGGGDVNNCLFRFTGTLLSNITVSPAVGDATTYFNGFYYFENLTSGSYTITVTTSAGSAVLPQGRRGVLFIDGTNGPRVMGLVGSSSADPIPAGSNVVFYNASAPAGYTQVTSLNNYALRLVSGTGAGAGGTLDFTSCFTTRTPAGTNSTSSIGSTTITIPGGGWLAGGVSGLSGYLSLATGYSAQDRSLTSNLTGTVNPQTFTGTARDFNVRYADVIICTRN